MLTVPGIYSSQILLIRSSKKCSKYYFKNISMLFNLPINTVTPLSYTHIPVPFLLKVS